MDALTSPHRQLLQPVLALLRAGEAAQACASLQAMPSAQRNAYWYFLFGSTLHALNRAQEAVVALQQALCLQPALHDARGALAAVLAELQHDDAALAEYDELARRLPEAAAVQANRGTLLERMQRFDEALAAYGEALRLNPLQVHALNNRAALQGRLGDPIAAIIDWQALACAWPEQWLPRLNMADTALAMAEYDLCLATLLPALRIPDAMTDDEYCRALRIAALAYAASARFTEANACFDELQQRAPQLYNEVLQSLNQQWGHAERVDPELILLLRQFDHQAIAEHRYQEAALAAYRRLLQKLQQPGAALAMADLSPLVFRALSLPLLPAELLCLARAASAQVQAVFSPVLPQQSVSSTSASTAGASTVSGQRIRLAYISPDVRQHAMAVIMQHVLALHDRKQFHVTLFALNAPDNSETARLFCAGADSVLWLNDMDDRAAAAAIRQQGIAILVDLGGYTTGARPGILAQRPAPVQASYMGLPASMGADFIDYQLADRQTLLHPEQHQEKIAWLPQHYYVFSPAWQQLPPERADRARWGLPENAFVFCCFNNAYKLDQESLELWVELLKAVPNSVLWLLHGSRLQQRNLLRFMISRGVAGERLIWAARVSPERHQARMAEADLFLDTRWYNGHTTVAESLWAGVPVLTWSGETFAARVAAAMNLSLGLPEMNVDSAQAYHETALRFVHDVAWRNQLQARLRARRLDSAPLVLPAQVAQLERAFVEICRCTGGEK